MQVDELFIPSRVGPVRVRIDPRLTVLAGLAPRARARLTDLLVGAVAGHGPASVHVRDDVGDITVRGGDGPGDGLGGADGIEVDGRRGAAILPVDGVGDGEADDRASLARAMVVRPGDLGLPEGRPEPRVHAEWTALSIDHRRLELELTASEAAHSERTGLERELGEVAGTALFTAADSVVAIGPRLDEILRRQAHAEAMLRDATVRDGVADAARAEVVRCDGELDELAAADAAPHSAARRLIARRRAMLRARIAELPDEAEVEGARRRFEIAASRLAELEEREPALAPAVAARVRTVLLGRAAGLRPRGVSGAAPLILDDPLVRLVPDARIELLDVIARVAERVQVVLLTEDDGITTWARHRSNQGRLRLIDITAPAPG